MTYRQIRFRTFLFLVVLALVFFALAGCNDRERVLGGAAVGAVAGAVIVDSLNDGDRGRGRGYHHHRAPRGYYAPPPRYYYRVPRDRYQHRRAPCYYDRYGRPVYRCR